MLIEIADIFDVGTNDLLGDFTPSSSDNTEQTNIAQQLSRINEYLAIKNKRSQDILKFISVMAIIALIISTAPFIYEMGITFGKDLSYWLNK